MVTIADRVWEHWEEVEPLGRPGVDLLLSSSMDAEEALRAVTRAAQESIQELESRHAGEEFSTGAYTASPTPGGVVLRIDEEPHDFEGLLRAVAQRLEAAGVDGTLDLLEHVPAPLPELVDLLECRLRVAGERHHFRGPNWGWRPDAAALEAGVEAAIGWCRANEPPEPLLLAVGLVAPVAVPARVDVRPYVHQGLRAVADAGVVRLTSGSPERFRIAAIEPAYGRISLIEGGVAIAEGAWRPALHGLEGVCRSASPWAVYGFVKRGSRRPDAEVGSLFADWVPMPHLSPQARLVDAFEDRYVPDAFGVQLLGRGHADRIPTGPDWKQAEAGAGAVLVEHRDPSAWLDGRLVPFGGHPLATLLDGTAPIPELVARARDDFGTLLFTDGVAGSEPA